MPDPIPWYRTRRGPPLVVGYAAVTLVVLALSTGWPSGVSIGDASAQVPPYVYLYGFLGGMTYAFTSIVAKFERGLRGVARVGLRALAALPLAAGVYLLAGPLGLPTDQVTLVAGLSFLVGLYVNVALKALGGLADRLFGRTNQADDAAGSGPSSTATSRSTANASGADAGQRGGSEAVADGAGDTGA